MAIFRQVHIDFWTDSKVSDNFTPEDRYFMLFLLTNPSTNMIGCYEISKKNMAFFLGYSIDTVNSLVLRFTNVHKIIQYDENTKEILILNWHKFNWINSPKLIPKMTSDLKQIKSSIFKETVHKLLTEFFKKEITLDTVSIPYQYPIDTVSREENEKENENKKENDKEREPKKNKKESGNGMSTISRPSPDSIPSISQISEFLKSKEGNESKADFTAKKFFSYYNALGWMINDQPIYDWKSLIDYWMEIKIQRKQNGYTGKSIAPVPEWLDEFKEMLDKGD